MASSINTIRRLLDEIEPTVNFVRDAEDAMRNALKLKQERDDAVRRLSTLEEAYKEADEVATALQTLARGEVPSCVGGNGCNGKCVSCIVYTRISTLEADLKEAHIRREKVCVERDEAREKLNLADPTSNDILMWYEDHKAYIRILKMLETSRARVEGDVRTLKEKSK